MRFRWDLFSLRNELLCSICALIVGILASPAQADEAFRLLDIDGHPVKWGTPKLGAGAVVTWHFATRTSQSGAVNCRAITPIEPLLAHSRIPLVAFERATERALSTWQAVANVRFVRVGEDKPANLTLAAEAVPDGTAYTDVTPTSPSGGISSISRAVICLNPKLQWTTAHAKGRKSVAYVLAHEIGHALGLDHPGPTGELMSFEYSETIQTLQPGDIAGVVSLYGSARQSGAVALNAGQ